MTSTAAKLLRTRPKSTGQTSSTVSPAGNGLSGKVLPCLNCTSTEPLSNSDFPLTEERTLGNRNCPVSGCDAESQREPDEKN